MSAMSQPKIKPSTFMHPELVSKLASANTAFAVDLYTEICKSQAENIFFSPMSISSVLAMAYLGACLNTAREIKETLKLSALSDQDIHKAYKDILQEGKSQTCTMEIANRIFAAKQYKFLEEFLDATRTFYNAEAQILDFQGETEESRKTINKWVEQKTANKIQDLLPPGAVESATAMVLVNAIYFKGDWKNKFNSDATKDRKFMLKDGKTVDVQMMSMQGRIPFGSNEELDCKAIELQYEGNELSMCIVLPNQDYGPKELEMKITADKLQKLTTEMNTAVVHVNLPKFKLQYQFSAKEALMALGIKDLFSQREADLSKMDGIKLLYASDVIHKAFVEVKEEGTEAAAATAMIMAPTGLCFREVEIETFVVDHPFLFFIRNSHSGGIYFMGRVGRPK